jgi:hypothetical protein
VNLTVLGVDTTIAKLIAVGVAGEAGLALGTRALAEEVAMHAKAVHPWQSESGETEASIHVEQRGTDTVVVAGGAAMFLEFGLHPGGGMTPRPFMRPAADSASGATATAAIAAAIHAV